MKKIIFAFFSALMFIVPVAFATDYSIDGSKVFIDDANVYLSASPHTIQSSGWVNFELTSKTFSGDIDVVWGFDTDVARPTRAEFYSPHTYNETKSYTCTPPNWYTYTTSPKHFWCWSTIYTPADANGTAESNITALVFEHDFEKVILATSTAVWNVTHYDGWRDVTSKFNSVSYEHGGMDRWYYIKDFSVTAGQTYQLRGYVQVTPQLGSTSGKYWFAAKPSSLTIPDAIAQGKFYSIDPWWNSAYARRTNFTIAMPSSSIVAIGADTQVVVPINWDTLTEISQGDLDSLGRDLTIVNQNNTLLEWSWCDYDSATYGINTAKTCLFVRDNIDTGNTTIFSFYYKNSGDTTMANSTFNETFSLRDNVRLLSLIYGENNGSFIKDREEDHTAGAGEWTKSLTNNIAYSDGLKVSAINVSSTSTGLISNTTQPFPDGDRTTFWIYKSPSGVAASSFILPDKAGGGGFEIRVNVAGAALYDGGQGSALSVGTFAANTWFFGIGRDGGTNHLLSGFNDTTFLNRTSGVSSVALVDSAAPSLFGVGSGFDWVGNLQLFMFYNGTFTDNEVNATWVYWSNQSSNLVVKQSEEATTVNGTSVTITLPLNATYSSAIQIFSFSVSGNYSTYSCSKYLNNARASVGNITNNSAYGSTYSLTLGANNITAECFGSDGQNSSDTVWATVEQTVLGNCMAGVPNTKILSFVGKDEETMVNMTQNFTMDATFRIWNATTAISSNSFHYVNQTSYDLCVYPSNTTALLSAEIEYESASNYPKRTYYLVNVVINATPTNETASTISLYLLNSTYADLITYTVQNTASTPIQGYYVETQRYYTSTDSYATVQISKSDYKGEALAYARLYDVPYRILVKADTTIRKLTPTSQIKGTSILLTIDPTMSLYWRYYGQLGYDCAYTNASLTLSCTVADTSSLATEACLTLTHIGQLTDTTVYDDCKSGTDIITVNYTWASWNDAKEKTFNYKLFAGLGSDRVFLYDKLLQPSGYVMTVIGVSGLIFTAIIIFTTAAMGFWNPAVAIIFGTFSFVICSILGLVTIGMSAVAGMVFASFIFIWRLRK